MLLDTTVKILPPTIADAFTGIKMVLFLGVAVMRGLTGSLTNKREMHGSEAWVD